jgi:hypothetical protein
MMAKPNEKLANALATLQSLQKVSKAIKSSYLTRLDREVLLGSGYLTQIISGWYIPSRPGDHPGDSTGWYSSIKDFIIAYCNDRFGSDWYVSPEYSLLLHSRSSLIPKQIIIHSSKGNNNPVDLPYNMSLLMYKPTAPLDSDYLTDINGIKAIKLDMALIRVTESFFKSNAMDAQISLSVVKDVSDILRILLSESKSTIAGRLAGAFRAVGKEDFADNIIQTMSAAGYKSFETNPFDLSVEVPLYKDESPYVMRLKVMWAVMRQDVIDIFKHDPLPPTDIEACLQDIEYRYIADAYNSLSIEGYIVSDELIERVRSGDWDPEDIEDDNQNKNAMAARGYWQAHNAVKDTIVKVLSGELSPGTAFRKDHQIWYREMFSPSVKAGILSPSDLAGYRNHQVYIRNAEHVPPSKEAVRDMMPTLSELLETEPSAAVRAVLGHFMFVYIHPYMDGNGRSGRFTMNAMLVTGGYPWTVIKVDTRNDYMSSLNDASARNDIKPFAKHIYDSMQLMDIIGHKV